MKRSISVARKVISGSLLACAMALPAAPVMAADMDYPIRGTTDYTPVEYGSGWYLRGDIGYNFIADTTLSYYSNDRYDYDKQSFSTGEMNWSLGAGYTFNEMLRADITADYSGNHSWEGTSKGSGCGLPPCKSRDEATMDRTTVMANAYVSLGRFGGISPYVGGGLGLSYVQWDDYTSTSSTATTSYNGESAVALTYALAAGFDYRINKNWLFDMGYKWTQIHGGVVIAEDSNGAGNPRGDSQFDNINLHEVKVGLRYEIW